MVRFERRGDLQVVVGMPFELDLLEAVFKRDEPDPRIIGRH